jgi:hypothetical protein
MEVSSYQVVVTDPSPRTHLDGRSNNVLPVSRTASAFTLEIVNPETYGLSRSRIN